MEKCKYDVKTWRLAREAAIDLLVGMGHVIAK